MSNLETFNFSNLIQSQEKLTYGLFTIEDDKISFCNSKFCQLFGYSSSEIINQMSLLDLTVEEEQPRLKEFLSELSSSQIENAEDTFELKHKNGNKFKVKISIIKVELHNNSKLIGSLNEVTEIKTVNQSSNILLNSLDQLDECIITSNLNGEIIYVNNPLCKLLDISSDSLIGRNVNELFASSLMQSSQNEFLINNHDDKSVNKFLYYTKSGSHILIFMRNIVIKNSFGLPVAQMFILKDVSDEDKLLGEIRRSEFNYRNLFDKMQDGFALVKVISDSNGTPVDLILLEANPALEKLVQLPLAKLLGKSLLQNFNKFENIKPNPFLIISRAALKKNEAHFEIEVKEVNKWFSISVYSPQKFHAFIIIHDITNRKKVQIQLSDSQQMLRTIIDNVPQRIFWKDLNSKFLGCNIHFAKDVGLSNPLEIVGKSEYDLYENDYADRFIQDDRRIIETKDIISSSEVEQPVKSGSGKILVRLNKMPLKNSEGKIIGVVGTYEDITHEKQVESNIIKLSQAVEQNPASIVITDVDGNIEYVNPKFSLITGYSYQEVLGKNPRILKSGYKSSEEYKDLWETITAGKQWAGEFLNKKKNGELYWELASISPIFDTNGRIINYLAIKEDITERKLAELQLQNSHSILESTLESTVDGILVVDNQGKIQRYNNKFLELWKIPTSLIQSGSDEEAINYVLEQVKYPDLFLAKIKELYSNMSTESTDIIEFKDGRVYERYSRPQYLQDKIIGRVWSFRDISEQKWIEKALSESEKKFRTLFETSAEGILSTDVYENILLVNPRMSELTGYSKDELIKMKFIDLLPEDEVADHKTKMRNRKEKISEVYERRLKKKDGTIIWTMVSASPLISQDGNFEGSFGTFTDITEKKKALEELKAAKERAEEINRLKSILLANISHELRTPLIGILGYAETLYHEIENPSFKEMAQILLKSGNRLKDTLNLILDLSQIEAEKIEMKLEPLKLIRVLSPKFKQFYHEAAEKNLKFKIIIEDDDIEILADEQMLLKAVEHLLSNAIKYTIKGSVTVSITKILRDEKFYAEIKVKDTGIGIPEERINQIFEPFRQASEGLARTYEGLGLGLTIAKKFIELLGGEISVSSKEGKGSEFTIILPTLDMHTKKITPSVLAIEDFKFTEDGNEYKYSDNVLLIEDDEPTANIIRIYLSEICKTDWANSGNKAIELAALKQYSLILVDINLGLGIDGIETISRIKKLFGYKDIPIVAVTAYALYGDKEKFLKQGCTHYISKPFDKSDIVQLVDKILSNKK